MNNKKAFLLYFDMQSTINHLTDEQAGKLLKMIFSLVVDGEEEKTKDQALNIIFDMVKNQINRDTKKYEEVCEKRRDAGKKGGLAKASNAKQSLANLADSDTASVNDKKKEIENENGIKIESDEDIADDIIFNLSQSMYDFFEITSKYKSLRDKIKDWLSRMDEETLKYSNSQFHYYKLYYQSTGRYKCNVENWMKEYWNATNYQEEFESLK